MNPDEERRRDDHVSARSNQTSEVGYGRVRVHNMFEHLFADHDVELASVRERGTQVEIRIVETLERTPVPLGMRIPADLCPCKLLSREPAQVFIDGMVHRHSQPMLGRRGRFGKCSALAPVEHTYRSSPEAPHEHAAVRRTEKFRIGRRHRSDITGSDGSEIASLGVQFGHNSSIVLL